MRVLLLCHRCPCPPNGGAKIRAYHVIRHLAASHEVTVATLTRSEEERRQGEALKEICSRAIFGEIGRAAGLLRMAARLPTRVPSSMGYFYSPGLARAVAEEVVTTPPDLIFVHSSSMAQYVEEVRGSRKILDFCDMDSGKWLAYARVHRFPLSMGYRIEGGKLQREEGRLATRFDLSTCATAAECAILDSFGTGAKSGWFPNGVDLEHFRPTDDPFEPDTIAFVGKMDYFPNREAVITFCRETLPLIRRNRPGVKFLIVGASPPADVRALGSMEGVTVTGSVPEVIPWLRRAALTVAPLAIARGTQNKILESMALGIPVVSSRNAAGGVDAVPGEHLLVADTPEEQAASVLRLLEDPQERTRLSLAGRARMESHHSWASAMRKLDEMIAALLATRGEGAARPAAPKGTRDGLGVRP